MARCDCLIYVGDKQHAAQIAASAGVLLNPQYDTCISVEKGGVLYGGVIYQGFTGSSIQMHMAGFSPHWMTKTFLWVAFDYPFNQLGCKIVLGQVSSANTRALEIDKKLGFKEAAKIDGVFPDGACHVLVLAREDCRWLKCKPRDFGKA